MYLLHLSLYIRITKIDKKAYPYWCEKETIKKGAIANRPNVFYSQ